MTTTTIPAGEATSLSTSTRVTRNVKHLLVLHDMNQDDLAAALGWHKSTISRLLKAERSWKLDDLDAVSEVFNITAHDLTGPAEELLKMTWFLPDDLAFAA